jgi:hypothetical protein
LAIEDTSFGSADDLVSRRKSIMILISRSISIARVNDRGTAFGLLLAIFLTRLISLSASLWEWDDILFARALSNYDVAAHSPHPPGYPVYVMLARIPYWLLKDELKALSVIGLIFSSLLAPALFYFYREVFQNRRIAIAGTLLTSFAPTVWVYSGAARSDETGLTLGIIGLTLIIRGLQSRKSLIAGCALLGLGMGVRVTLFPVIGPAIAVVFFARLRRREWRLVAICLAVGTIGLLTWYVPMLIDTGWERYCYAAKWQTKGLLVSDTIFYNTGSMALWHRFTRFFRHVWGPAWLMSSIYGLSLLGLISLALKRSWRIIGWMFVCFLPYLLFTLMINTPVNAHYYSMPYLPLFTGLAVCGLLIPPTLMKNPQSCRWLENAGFIIIIVLTIGSVVWLYPIIKIRHIEASPPIRAIEYLKRRMDPQSDTLFTDGIFTPHLDFYAPDLKNYVIQQSRTPETNLICPMILENRIFALTNDPSFGSSLSEFHWGGNQRRGNRLYWLSTGVYCHAYVTEVTDSRRVVFQSGWYDEERHQDRSHRRMGRYSKAALLNNADTMTLKIRISKQMSMPDPSTVVMCIDGKEIDRFIVVKDEVERFIIVKTNPRALWSALTIDVEGASKLGEGGISDGIRDFGLLCSSLQWTPAPHAVSTQLEPDQFIGPGWISFENGHQCVRWTGQSATIFLPPVAGDAQLGLFLSVPADEGGTRAGVVVKIAGQVIGTIHPEVYLAWRNFRVPASVHHNQPTELVLSLDKQLVTNADRPGGIRVSRIDWMPSN